MLAADRRAYWHLSIAVFLLLSMGTGYLARYGTHTVFGLMLIGASLVSTRLFHKGWRSLRSVIRLLLAVLVPIVGFTGLISYDDFSYSGPLAALLPVHDSVVVGRVHSLLAGALTISVMLHVGLQLTRGFRGENKTVAFRFVGLRRRREAKLVRSTSAAHVP